MSPLVVFTILGISLIVIEVAIFQVTVFWLLLIGLGALVAVAYAALPFDNQWVDTIGVFIAATVAICLLAYKPLVRWQKKPSILKGHDAIGQACRVLKVEDNSLIVSWSGTEWTATLCNNFPVAVDDTVYIERINGINLTVSNKPQ